MAKGLNPTLKHGSAADWAKAINYIPKEYEIIVYDANEIDGPPKIKIGDGKTKVNDLPFAGYSNFEVENNTLTLF